MDDVFATQLMEDASRTVSASASVKEVAAAVTERGCTVVVNEDGSLHGVATTSHIVKCVADGLRPNDTIGQACIRTDTLTVQAQAPVRRLAWMMEQNTVGCIPVLGDDGRVVGVLYEDAVEPYAAGLR